jgi:CheY-like chemotaxis protein
MEGRIHLLYSDMVMPEGMTGIELARRLREKSPSLPVIITSGYSADLVAKGGAATENMTYVPKPCPPLVLCKTLRECLNKKG